jgi:COP9 signalosome complex subunit 3
MATAMEEMMKLIEEGPFDTAGQHIRDNWGQIIDLNMDQVSSFIGSTSPQDHSLVWLAALTVEMKQTDIDWPSLLSHMATFTANFTPALIHLHPVAFCELVHQYTELLCTNRKAILGIAAVREAIRRYSPNEHTLTAIHCDLIQLCLAAKCVKPSLPFLDRDYNSLLTDKSQLDSKQVMQFFYYGGMVYTCLHDYLRALQLFTMCLCVPAMAVSAVMLASYKKYILVCLLKYGKLIPLPKCASHFVEKVFKVMFVCVVMVTWVISPPRILVDLIWN